MNVQVRALNAWHCVRCALAAVVVFTENRLVCLFWRVVEQAQLPARGERPLGPVEVRDQVARAMEEPRFTDLIPGGGDKFLRDVRAPVVRCAAVPWGCAHIGVGA